MILLSYSGGSDIVLDSPSDESACMGPNESPNNSISLCPVSNGRREHKSVL